MLLAIGDEGIALTTTVVVPARLTHPVVELVTVTLYVPAIARVAGDIVGFWEVEEYALGPDQLMIPVVDVVKLTVPPSHTGELLLADGAAGKVLTVTETEAVLLQPFPSVPVTI